VKAVSVLKRAGVENARAIVVTTGDPDRKVTLVGRLGHGRKGGA
jgi:voltage-gated potassium channel Kch